MVLGPVFRERSELDLYLKCVSEQVSPTTSVPLSSGELDRLRASEFSKTRLLRLIQVREQDKFLALSRRQRFFDSVQSKKKKLLNEISSDSQEAHSKALEKLYQAQRESLTSIGQGHRQADTVRTVKVYSLEKREERERAVHQKEQERGAIALEKDREERRERNEKREHLFNVRGKESDRSRRQARRAEKLRQHREEQERQARARQDEEAKRRRELCDVKEEREYNVSNTPLHLINFSQTRFHATVVKHATQVPNDDDDAFKKADVLNVEIAQRKSEQETVVKEREQSARERGRQAMHKVIAAKERAALEQDLDRLKQADRIFNAGNRSLVHRAKKNREILEKRKRQLHQTFQERFLAVSTQEQQQQQPFEKETKFLVAIPEEVEQQQHPVEESSQSQEEDAQQEQLQEQELVVDESVESKNQDDAEVDDFERETRQLLEDSRRARELANQRVRSILHLGGSALAAHEVSPSANQLEKPKQKLEKKVQQQPQEEEQIGEQVGDQEGRPESDEQEERMSWTVAMEAAKQATSAAEDAAEEAQNEHVFPSREDLELSISRYLLESEDEEGIEEQELEDEATLQREGDVRLGTTSQREGDMRLGNRGGFSDLALSVLRDLEQESAALSASFLTSSDGSSLRQFTLSPRSNTFSIRSESSSHRESQQAKQPGVDSIENQDEDSDLQVQFLDTDSDDEYDGRETVRTRDALVVEDDGWKQSEPFSNWLRQVEQAFQVEEGALSPSQQPRQESRAKDSGDEEDLIVEEDDWKLDPHLGTLATAVENLLAGRSHQAGSPTAVKTSSASDVQTPDTVGTRFAAVQRSLDSITKASTKHLSFPDLSQESVKQQQQQQSIQQHEGDTSMSHEDSSMDWLTKGMQNEESDTSDTVVGPNASGSGSSGTNLSGEHSSSLESLEEVRKALKEARAELKKAAGYQIDSPSSLTFSPRFLHHSPTIKSADDFAQDESEQQSESETEHRHDDETEHQHEESTTIIEQQAQDEYDEVLFGDIPSPKPVNLFGTLKPAQQQASVPLFSQDEQPSSATRGHSGGIMFQIPLEDPTSKKSKAKSAKRTPRLSSKPASISHATVTPKEKESQTQDQTPSEGSETIVIPNATQLQEYQRKGKSVAFDVSLSTQESSKDEAKRRRSEDFAKRSSMRAVQAKQKAAQVEQQRQQEAATRKAARGRKLSSTTPRNLNKQAKQSDMSTSAVRMPGEKGVPESEQEFRKRTSKNYAALPEVVQKRKEEEARAKAAERRQRVKEMEERRREQLLQRNKRSLG